MQINVRKIFAVVFAAIMIVGDAHAAEWTNAGKKLAEGRVWELGAMEIYRQDIKNARGVLKYYEICDGKKPTNGTSICVDDMFNWTNVNAREAWNLAKDYAKIRDNVDIICHPSIRQSWNDDYIMCAAADGSARYYEFQFDDVRESLDDTVRGDVRAALCNIYGGNTSAGDAAATGTGVNNSICHSLKDSATCTKLGAKYVEYFYTKENPVKWYPSTAKYHNDTKCVFNVNEEVITADDLNTMKGIDSYIFRNFQFNNAADAESMIRRYLDKKLGTLDSFECSNSTRSLYRGGNSDTDDVLTCFPNGGAPVDFVFDDVRETDFFDKYSREATMGMECLGPSGGVYDGVNCWGLQNEAACDKFEKLYPESGGTDWDEDLRLCKLKDSQDAETFKKWKKGLTSAGFTIVAIAATALSAGSAAPVFVVLGVAGAAASTAGTTMTIISDAKFPDESRLVLGRALSICPVIDIAPGDCPQKINGEKPEDKAANYELIVSTLGEVEQALYNSANVNDNLDAALLEIATNCILTLKNCWTEEERAEAIARVQSIKEEAKGCTGNMRGIANCLTVAGALLSVGSFGLEKFTKLPQTAKFLDAMGDFGTWFQTANTASKASAATQAAKGVKTGRAIKTVSTAVGTAASEAAAAERGIATGIQTLGKAKVVKVVGVGDAVGTGNDLLDSIDIITTDTTVLQRQ